MPSLDTCNKHKKAPNRHNKLNKHNILQSKQPYLSVIGGSFKGLKLFSPATFTTRPTKAILKESLFNTLGCEIIDICFIEGFCGSGSVGIEALSRGAKRIIFLEKEEIAIDTLKKNIKRLNPINQAQTEIIAGDSFIHLPRILKNLNAPTLLYLDPPFLTRTNYADIYQHCLTLIAQIQNPYIKKVVIEHSSAYNMPLDVGFFTCVKTRKFGNSALTYLIQGA